MSRTKPRWNRFYVATTATALLTSGSAHSASASQKHVLQPGESLSAVARRYHVSIQDLKDANHFDDATSIPDYKVLVIPPPPQQLHLDPTLHEVARIKGDQVSLRLGPDVSYRRSNYVFSGSDVTVTARRGEWAQVKLDSGAAGWIRSDFLAIKGTSQSSEVAHSDVRVNGVASKHSSEAMHYVARSSRKIEHHEVAQRGRIVKHPDSHYLHEHRVKLARAEREKHHSGEPVEGRHRKIHIAEASHSRSHHHKMVVYQNHHHKTHAVAYHSRHHETHAVAYHSRHHETHAVAYHSRHHENYAIAEGSRASGDIVHTALAYRGTPYVYGGEGRGGFDCSGFTSYLYGRKGISLPHSARAQFEMGRGVHRDGLKPGDLVFFHTVTSGISHVGMYVGNGRFVHASSRRSGGVRVDNLDSGYYSHAFRGARRLSQ